MALAVGGALGLSACSTQGGQDLAQQACGHVHLSVTDYLRAVNPRTTPAAAAQLQKEADQQLRDALPLAAAANSDDGSWNSLMTTISEGATVDELADRLAREFSLERGIAERDVRGLLDSLRGEGLLEEPLA